MSQVNFRLSEEELNIIKNLAEDAGLSVAEFSKRIIQEKISPIRIDMAFKLLSQGKIHKKKAWLLSGLTYSEFMIEWSKRGGEDIVPDQAEEKGIQLALSLELKKYRKVVEKPK